MRLGILSDTHDRVGRTSRAMSILLREGIEALIHCGDITTPEVVLECAGVPGYFVLGNNDWDESGLKRCVERIGGVWMGRGGLVELGGASIGVTHGDSVRELQNLTRRNPDYVMHGHTHQCMDEYRDATRWINPGALHRATVWTVAILDTETRSLRFVDIGASV